MTLRPPHTLVQLMTSSNFRMAWRQIESIQLYFARTPSLYPRTLETFIAPSIIKKLLVTRSESFTSNLPLNSCWKLKRVCFFEDFILSLRFSLFFFLLLHRAIRRTTHLVPLIFSGNSYSSAWDDWEQIKDTNFRPG